MGMGERKKRGARFRRRRGRQVRDDVPRSGIRRHGESSGGIFSCCCGALIDPCERNQEDILLLYEAQQQMLASFKQQTRQVNLDQENPVWRASHDQERMGQVEDLQTEQLGLFNDILKQQSKEKDDAVVQELYKQQCQLIEQMQELQAAGYAYPGGIPSAQTVNDQNGESTERTVSDMT